MLIDARERKRAGAEAEFAGVAMYDNVDGIEACPAAQGARNLFRSRLCAAEKDRHYTGPQSRDQRGNVRDGGIDKNDFVRA